MADAVGHLRDTVRVLRDDEGDRATAPTTESVVVRIDARPPQSFLRHVRQRCHYPVAYELAVRP